MRVVSAPCDVGFNFGAQGDKREQKKKKKKKKTKRIRVWQGFLTEDLPRVKVKFQSFTHRVCL